MPINTALLVTSPTFQEAIVDKDGTAMAFGTVTCYQDNSRTTLKNWYYQSGTPGAYTYIRLPNPLTLSSAGSVCDINGVDTMPFFYPFSELDEIESQPYYITIVNHEQTNQITRAYFPFPGSQSGSATTVDIFNNLVVNGSFWRNIQPNTVNITPYVSVALNSKMSIPPGGIYYSAVVAPSQNNGYRMPDIQFLKDNLDGTDTVTFIPFALGTDQPINNALIPEYYLSHNCTQAGGELQKCYQFPISLHVNSLDSVPFTFSIEAQNAGGTGTGQNVITVFIFQDTGTGGTSVTAKEIGQITLNSTWDRYTFTNIFDSSAGLNLGLGSDDGWYLQIQMPLDQLCTINFTKPSIYLTEDIVPTNDFESYATVNSIINSPRTGDMRTSLNNFHDFGWVQANDGTIGTAASMATSRANSDTWKLYNLLWNAVNNSFAPVSGGRGANAYADFSANKTIGLTLSLGRSLIGLPPAMTVASYTLTAPSWNTTKNGFFTLTTGTILLYPGAPVVLSGTSLNAAFTTGTLYYAIPAIDGVSTTQFQLATNYANALAGTAIIASGSNTGSSITITYPLGGSFGQDEHVQLNTELAAHTHNAPPAGNFWINSGTADTGSGTSSHLDVAGTTGDITRSNAAGNPFNIVQPVTYMNVFFKL